MAAELKLQGRMEAETLAVPWETADETQRLKRYYAACNLQITASTTSSSLEIGFTDQIPAELSECGNLKLSADGAMAAMDKDCAIAWGFAPLTKLADFVEKKVGENEDARAGFEELKSELGKKNLSCENDYKPLLSLDWAVGMCAPEGKFSEKNWSKCFLLAASGATAEKQWERIAQILNE